MSLILPQTCNMGSSQTGLVGTIGVELLNPDGTTKTARATAGIYEIGGGSYGKEITFDDNWSGVIVWDTGGGTPYYATVEYNIEGLVDAVLEDTNDLQTSQGDWLTATGFSVPNEYDTVIADLPTVAEFEARTLVNADYLVVADLSDTVIEGTLTIQQAFMVFLAALAGKSDGGKTALQHFRNTLDTKNRITAVVDGSGNRTSITLDLT